MTKSKTPKTKEQIESLFDKISDEYQEESEILSNQMYFVLETLEDLQKQIREKGTTEKFEQGKQNFIRENPALKSYIQLMKTYDSLYKNILNLINESKGKGTNKELEEDKEFDDFMFDNFQELGEQYQEETGEEDYSIESKKYKQFCYKKYKQSLEEDDFDKF